MEDAPQLDWNSAEVESGTVTVRWLAPGPSGEMGAALSLVIQRMESETRGQQWDSIEVSWQGVIARRVEPPSAAESLRLYLAEAADHARVELDQQVKAVEAHKQEAERAAAQRARDDEELQRRLRGS
jgi:hypothetical protein